MFIYIKTKTKKTNQLWNEESAYIQLSTFQKSKGSINNTKQWKNAMIIVAFWMLFHFRLRRSRN